MPRDAAAVLGHHALDPLQAADRRRLHRVAGQDLGPPLDGCRLAGLVEDVERASAHAEHGDVGVPAPVLDDADWLAGAAVDLQDVEARRLLGRSSGGTASSTSPSLRTVTRWPSRCAPEWKR